MSAAERADAPDTAADVAALERVLAARPAWHAVRRLRDVLGDDRRVLLHAGPPYADGEAIPPAVRNSLLAACRVEGWAQTWEDAEALLDAGAVAIEAAQDHGVLVPLAGVASPSMALAEVRDGADGPPSWAVLNEGNTCATRLGTRDEALLDHHRWLDGELADWLARRFDEPLELLPLLRASLEAGDDGHSRTGVGSVLLAAALRAPERGAPPPPRAAAFLDDSVAFALNLWMAACACALQRAAGVAGAALVIRAAGNGVRTGVQLAQAPGVWVTAPAPTPHGPLPAEHAAGRATPALGDSAVVDLFGLGGQALGSALDVRNALGAHLPEDWAAREAEVLCAEHPALGGKRVVTSARRVAAAGRGPLVLLGMIDARGEAGRIGGGVVETPPELFAAALAMTGDRAA